MGEIMYPKSRTFIPRIWTLLFIGALLLCGVGVGSGLLLTRSLEVYASLLPDDSYTLMFGKTDSMGQINAFNEASEALLSTVDVSGDMHTRMSSYARFVYAKSSNGETIVGIKRQSGNVFTRFWRTVRGGIITRVNSDGVEEKIGLWSIVKTEARTVAKGFTITSVFPEALVRIQKGVVLGNTQPLTLSINLTNGTLRGNYVVGDSGEAYGESKTMELLQKSVNSEELYVSIQSKELELFRLQLIGQIEDEIVTKSGFSSHKISVLKSIGDIDSVGVLMNTDDAAMGLRGGKADEIVSSWIDIEYGKNHPVSQSFSLPDGTRGFEVVPKSGVGDIYSETGDSSCSSAKVDGISLTVCKMDDWVLVGKNQDTVARLAGLLGISESMNVVLHIPEFETDDSEVFSGLIVGSFEAGEIVIAPKN